MSDVGISQAVRSLGYALARESPASGTALIASLSRIYIRRGRLPSLEDGRAVLDFCAQLGVATPSALPTWMVDGLLDHLERDAATAAGL